MIDLNKIPETNTEWAAQRIADSYTKRQIIALRKQLKRLDEVLYKSWAKDLSITELREAVDMLDSKKQTEHF